MKLLFLIQGLKSGGAERVMSVLVNEISSMGHQVILGLTETVDEQAYDINDNVKILNLIQKKGSAVKNRIAAINALRNIYKNESPDAVISFITRTNLCAIIAGLGLKTRIFVSERNNPDVDPKSKITRFIRTIIYPKASGCVFQTDYAMNYFGKKIRNKSIVISNPVTTEVLKCRDNKIRRKRVIAVCRLEPQKNLSMLISAFSKISKKHKDYTLDIFGVGGLKDKLQEQIDTLGLSNIVKLKGYSSNSIEEMSQSEIFVLSSDYEGMPNALLEAMCVGCACISTDAPAYGARLFLKDGINGLFVSVNDEKKLVESLDKLMSDTELKNLLSENAKKIYDDYEKTCISKQWLNFISEG